MGFLVFSGCNLILAASAAAICAYIAPAAAGSGIPEVKAYLNGVDAHSILAPSTLFVKVINTLLGFCAPDREINLSVDHALPSLTIFCLYQEEIDPNDRLGFNQGHQLWHVG